MAGTVGIVLRRYAGVTLNGAGIYFTPALPPQLHEVRFRLHWRTRWVSVELTPGRLCVRVDNDHVEPVPVHVNGERHSVPAGETLTVEL